MDDIRTDFFIDPEAIKQAYLNAFSQIEFPDNFDDYANKDHTVIESRAPGTPITAKIWNDTINELRNICRALVASMAAYNVGVEDALDSFTAQVNDLLQHLLDVDQAALIEWLMQQRFSASFDEPTINESYLVITIGEGPDAVEWRSSNLKENQVFWLFPDEPQPVDGEGNPTWRIKLDTSEQALADALVTQADLDDAVAPLITSDRAETIYARKSIVGTKLPATPLEATNCWAAIREICTAKIGDKPLGSEILATTCWGAIEEIAFTATQRETLDHLAEIGDDLIGLAGDIDALDDRVEDLETNLEGITSGTLDTINENMDALSTDMETLQQNVSDALSGQKTIINNDLIALYNGLVELQTFAHSSYASTDPNNAGSIWAVNKTNSMWVPQQFALNSADARYKLIFNYPNNVYVSKSNVSLEMRNGWCNIKMNLYFRSTAQAVNNNFVVPILQLPEWAYPNVNGYDYTCPSHTTLKNESYLRIICPDNRSYSTPAGTVTFSKPTLVLIRFMDGEGTNIKLPDDTFIKAEVTFPTMYRGFSLTTTHATVNLNTPELTLIP